MIQEQESGIDFRYRLLFLNSILVTTDVYWVYSIWYRKCIFSKIKSLYLQPLMFTGFRVYSIESIEFIYNIQVYVYIIYYTIIVVYYKDASSRIIYNVSKKFYTLYSSVGKLSEYKGFHG